jgi:hypothetical protein
MQNSEWIGLLRRIPPAEVDRYILVTSIGIEIALMQILRMEDEYLVLRGRLAGTSDAGRAFFVPYDQINFVSSVTPVSEEVVRALFGEVPPVEAQKPEIVPAPDPAAAAAEVPQEVVPAPTPLPPSTSVAGPGMEPARPPARAPLPGKAALLERLRARARGEEAKPAPDK